MDCLFSACRWITALSLLNSDCWNHSLALLSSLLSHTNLGREAAMRMPTVYCALISPKDVISVMSLLKNSTEFSLSSTTDPERDLAGVPLLKFSLVLHLLDNLPHALWPPEARRPVGDSACFRAIQDRRTSHKSASVRLRSRTLRLPLYPPPSHQTVGARRLLFISMPPWSDQRAAQ